MQVVSVAATFCEVWEGVTSLVAEVDVLAGFAELATSAPVAYVRPTMLPSDAGEISLIGCRCAILLSPPSRKRVVVNLASAFCMLSQVAAMLTSIALTRCSLAPKLCCLQALSL